MPLRLQRLCLLQTEQTAMRREERRELEDVHFC